MKKYFRLLLVIILFFTIVGCKETEDAKKYTIAFETSSEETLEKIVIEKAQTINLPTPIRKGYKFLGWYPSTQFVDGTKVTNETIIGKSITLHARWEPIEIKINLDLNGGYTKEEIETVFKIQTIDLIDLPKVYKDGYIFDGWYNNNQKVDSETEFLEDTHLVAKFIPLNELQESYSLTLNTNGGKFYEFEKSLPQEVLDERDYQRFKNENLTNQVNKLHYEFLLDYFQFNKWPYNIVELKYSIFDYTYNRLIGNTGFFAENEMHAKWLWLIQYLEYLANDENKPHLEELYKNNYLNDNNSDEYFDPSACIRIELAGFIYVDQEIYGNNLYVSHEYKEEEILELRYLLNANTYQTGKEVPILAPIKDGYKFLGWYDNPEFRGDAIWKISDNWYGDKVLYAKWEEN